MDSNSSSILDSRNKEINDLLPSNLLQEIDFKDAQDNLTSYSDDSEGEIVDNLAFVAKPSSNQTSNMQKPRLFSDSPIFPMQYQGLFSSVTPNSVNKTFPYLQNPYFTTGNNFFPCPLGNSSTNSQNIFAFCHPSTQPERRRTYTEQEVNFNSLKSSPTFSKNSSTFNKKRFSEPINYGRAFSNKNNTLSNKIHDINIDKYEIDEFKSYLNSLGCTPCEFLCTQKGAKEMQKYLLKTPIECKTILIQSLGASLSKVMKDIYGNYFIQEILDTCTQEQINLMLHFVYSDFVQIAKDYSGTHVLQAILDVISDNPAQMNIILQAIKNQELDMAYNSNATHVLQKIILTIPEENRINLNEIILSNICNLCLNSDGVCLVKKFISSTKSPENKKRIISALTEYCLEIAQDPYGNYAIQFLFDEWGLEQTYTIVNVVIENITSLSMQKFSSNVSEKLIEYIDINKRNYVFGKLFSESTLLQVLKNKYGRFVLQKAIKIMQKNKKEELKNSLSRLVITSSKEKNRLKSFLACF